MATILSEQQWQALLRAITEHHCVIPAPVLTELYLTAPRRGQAVASAAQALVNQIVANGGKVMPFGGRHADITATARDLYGKGNGKGGLLNFGDLMVYAIAKDSGLPLLCTGNDFASTDLVLHPASRIDP